MGDGEGKTSPRLRVFDSILGLSCHNYATVDVLRKVVGRPRSRSLTARSRRRLDLGAMRRHLHGAGSKLLRELFDDAVRERIRHLQDMAIDRVEGFYVGVPVLL